MSWSLVARLASLSAVAVLSVATAFVPAQPVLDTNLDGVDAGAVSETTGDVDAVLDDQQTADATAMPDNPAHELPEALNDDIPDDASVVSPDLAVTVEGEVLDLATGEPVSDAAVVGTPETPADPLAKTDGESFVPVGVSEVRGAMDAAGVDAGLDASSSSDAAGTVRPAVLQNNQYGAYWGTYNGTPAFFEADGTLFVQQAKGVIDVSEWQGQIDWQAVKNSGVDGAIIRISYGWNNGFDKQALRNISECKRLGIPFGVYSYSYAYDNASAAAEGSDMVSLLRKAGVSPGDLSYPVFYDLEQWTWTGHKPPTSPSVYDGIVNTWYSKLQAAGYTNLSVYSYTSYLNGPLNSSNIRGKTRWVASYGRRTGFSYATNDRGWQYTSSGKVNGINGNVDLNAFGVQRYVAQEGGIAVYRSNNGWLGYPTGDELSVRGGASQTFQGGTVFWNGSTGATHAVKGG
ncbi:GH25 family lysozyme, partial [Bifidobacterium phasiani]